jgi:predicted membrane protein
MKNNFSRNLLWGGLIVAVGVIFLLFNIGVLPAGWRNVVISWQALLILLGIIGISRKDYFSGLILIVLGGLFILPKLSIVMGFSYSASTVHAIVWPALIIAFGLLIIFHRNCFRCHGRRTYCDGRRERIITSSTGINDGKIDYTLIMNGIDEVFLEPVFNGGDINAILGGAKLDLRKTKLPEGDTILKISSICGGVTLLVPMDWKVDVKSDSIFGGFADKRPEKGTETDRRLIIEASFILGGGSIE